ncbi:nucleotidyltransferase family protein [Marinomonas shanghaiensis]|uniref:nucleotidyltransferase family protein n=1 Tax=Marinomonas shanghaiensis TaxID=2202418 RepID=UPI003A8CEA85
MFEAIILAGGKGTRLKSVTGDLPKPMVDVGGQPFLYLIMKRLEKQGCRHIILSLCYRADYIIERIKKDKPVDIAVDFCVEVEPLGTGGAIKLAANMIENDSFLVLNGDTYSELDYSDVAKFSEATDLVICGVEVSDVSRYGTLEVDEFNNVKHLFEKGKSGKGIINSGTYVINKNSILSFASDAFSFEQDYVQNFNLTFRAFISDGYFIDIGIPEDYYKACKVLK